MVETVQKQEVPTEIASIRHKRCVLSRLRA